jgi:hypothetical protein
MRQRDDGACHAYSKADGSCYGLQRSEYPRLLAEWMAGRAFFIGIGFYGSTLALKLGDIVAVSDCSPESLAADRQDQAQNDSEDALSI